MKRTRAGVLVLLGLICVASGFLVELVLTAIGRPILVPPISLAITLVAIAAIILAVAIPIYRAVKGRSDARINPFQAVRVAILAKASSLCGTLLAGGSVGLLLYIATRTVLPAPTSIWLGVASTVGAFVLLTAGLIAEYMCTIPPGEDPDDPMLEHAPHQS